MTNDQEATPQSVEQIARKWYAQKQGVPVNSVDQREEPKTVDLLKQVDKKLCAMYRDGALSQGHLNELQDIYEDALAYRAGAESRAPQTPLPCKDCEANDRDFRTIAEELALTEHTREAIVKRIRETREDAWRECLETCIHRIENFKHFDEPEAQIKNYIVSGLRTLRPPADALHGPRKR